MKLKYLLGFLVTLSLSSCAHLSDKNSNLDRGIAAENPIFGEQLNDERYDLSGKKLDQYGPRSEDTFQSVVTFNEDIKLISKNITGPNSFAPKYSTVAQIVVAKGRQVHITETDPREKLRDIELNALQEIDSDSVKEPEEPWDSKSLAKNFTPFCIVKFSMNLASSEKPPNELVVAKKGESYDITPCRSDVWLVTQ